MNWAERVLLRDFRCALCSVKKAAEAHHIYPKKSWPELRLDINNGIGLCAKCHRLLYSREEGFIERLLGLRPDQAKALGTKLLYIAMCRGTKVGITTRRHQCST